MMEWDEMCNEGWTHDFLCFLDTSLHLRNLALDLILGLLVDLSLSEDLQRLLGI